MCLNRVICAIAKSPPFRLSVSSFQIIPASLNISEDIDIMHFEELTGACYLDANDVVLMHTFDVKIALNPKMIECAP